MIDLKQRIEELESKMKNFTNQYRDAVSPFIRRIEELEKNIREINVRFASEVSLNKDRIAELNVKFDKWRNEANTTITELKEKVETPAEPDISFEMTHPPTNNELLREFLNWWNQMDYEEEYDAYVCYSDFYRDVKKQLEARLNEPL